MLNMSLRARKRVDSNILSLIATYKATYGLSCGRASQGRNRLTTFGTRYAVAR